MIRFPRAQRCQPRRGTISVVVVVVLMLIMAMVAQYTRRAVADRRQLVTERQYQQTLQLAEAGILRAQQQYSRDSDYTGETWTLPAGQLHQTNSAQVVITLKDNTATAVAMYPVNMPNPRRVTRQVSLK